MEKETNKAHDDSTHFGLNRSERRKSQDGSWRVSLGGG